MKQGFSFDRLKLSIQSWLHILPTSAWDGIPLGVDVSSYQGVIDWGAMKAKGVRFAAIRSGLSWGTQDPKFSYNWKEAKARGIFRMAYHVLYPGEDARKQSNFLYSLLRDDPGELPPAWDVELSHGLSKEIITNAAHSVTDFTSEWCGKPCFIYTAKWFTEAHMVPQAWYGNVWWWLAQYLYANPLTGYAEEHPGPVSLPVGVSVARVLVHQTAGKYNSTGFGVESKNIDTDRWLQGFANLYSMAGQTQPPAVTLENLNERVERLEEKVFGG